MPPRSSLAPTLPGRTRSTRRRPAGAALMLVLASVIVGACGDRTPAGEAVLDGLVALVAEPDATTMTTWDAAGGAFPLDLPKGATVWISSGRAGVLAASQGSGDVYTSDPVRLRDPLDWRRVEPQGPSGKAPDGPMSFATWDPKGGRYAALAGDLGSGRDLRIVLVDPSVGSASEIDLGRSVVAAPLAWIDDDRLVVVTGDASAPVSTIVDTKTGKLSDGPAGASFVATSANGRRVATMTGPGQAVVIRDTEAWLAGDGSSIGSVEPPTGTTAAVAFALDEAGQRLAIAWSADDGSIRLAVHDGRSGWRRIGEPEIRVAHGAVVAWRR